MPENKKVSNEKFFLRAFGKTLAGNIVYVNEGQDPLDVPCTECGWSQCGEQQLEIVQHGFVDDRHLAIFECTKCQTYFGAMFMIVHNGNRIEESV